MNKYQSYIRKTCPCHVYPLEPHFYIEKLGYAGIYLFFLFLLENRDCERVPTISVLSNKFSSENIPFFYSLKISVYCMGMFRNGLQEYSDSIPIEIPAWEPAKLTFVCEMAPILIWSNALVKKAANVLQNGTVLPRVPHPMATPTRFCSAMKHSM